MGGPRHILSASSIGLAVLMAVAGSADGNGRYAIRAGKIVTVTQGVINNGVVLIADGKIQAVGPASEIDIPKGHEVIDASDKWLMPGMVEIHSHAGAQGGLNDMVSQTNPGMRIGDGVDPDSEIITMALAAGVTTIQTLPGSGTNHGGFGVAFKTAGKTKKDRIVRRVSAMKIAQAYNPERPGGDLGATRMGMAWMLREHLDRAKAYEDASVAHERGKGKKPPKPDIALEMTRPIFRGELPVLIHTYETWGMLMTMAMLGERYGARATATHCAFNGHRAADTVGKLNFPVNIGPRVTDFYGNGDARFRGMIPTYAEGGTTELSVNTDS
ncbi:MAG TPA: hypothetical protein QGH10_14485, partial [Armatimonadota bacterium]|nr:hypothetical protein [Armatimonadota bacterium]